MELSELRKLALWRGARRRCPQCGENDLFRRYARLADECPHCGLLLRREQGAQTGSMYLTAAISQLFACVLIFALWFGTDWSPAMSTAVALPIVLGICCVLLPWCQSMWVAVEYVTDAVNDEPWVNPR